MRLDDLAPELLQYCVYSGHLSTDDILRLACSSKDMLDRLTGDDYALARLRATCGLETCIVKGWSRAFVFVLQTQKPNVRMFFRACDMDRTEILEALLEWNKTGKLSVTISRLFNYSVDRNYVNVVQKLLTIKGRDGEHNGLICKQAFVMACTRGCGEIVEMFLAWRGPNGEYFDPTSEPFFTFRPNWANAHMRAVQDLLTWKGPKGMRVQKEFRAPILHLFDNFRGHVKIFKDLLAWRGSQGEFFGLDNIVYVFQQAVRLRHASIVEELLAWRGPNGEYVDASNPSNSRIDFGIVDLCNTVQVLLSWIGPNGERVDPTLNDNEIFRMAVIRQRLATVQLLLAWKGPDGAFVDPTVDDNHAIRCAAEKGDVAMVRLLLDWEGPNGERVDPTAQDNYALHHAVDNFHLVLAKMLLSDPRVDLADPSYNPERWSDLRSQEVIPKLSAQLRKKATLDS